MSDEESKELEKLEEISDFSNAPRKHTKRISLVDEFLIHQPEEIVRNVLPIVEKCNIDKNDPFWVVLLQCRITQLVAGMTGDEIKKAMEIAIEQIDITLTKAEEKLTQTIANAAAKYEKENNFTADIRLKKAVANILEDNNLSSGSKGGFSPRVMGSLVTATAVLFGSIISFWGGTQFNNSAVAVDWKQKLEAQDRVLLDWAKSSEGQLAKNIVGWNEDLVDKSCQSKVKNLGISFQIGSVKATDGFCVVFVEPPSKRSFR